MKHGYVLAMCVALVVVALPLEGALLSRDCPAVVAALSVSRRPSIDFRDMGARPGQRRQGRRLNVEELTRRLEELAQPQRTARLAEEPQSQEDFSDEDAGELHAPRGIEYGVEYYEMQRDGLFPESDDDLEVPVAPTIASISHLLFTKIGVLRNPEHEAGITDVNARRDEQDNTLLHMAIAIGDYEVVKWLLGAGAYGDIKNKQQLSPIGLSFEAMIASRGTEKHASSVRINKLLRNYFFETDINAVLKNGFTPLKYAVEMRDIGMVEFLMDHGADCQSIYDEWLPKMSRGQAGCSTEAGYAELSSIMRVFKDHLEDGGRLAKSEHKSEHKMRKPLSAPLLGA